MTREHGQNSGERGALDLLEEALGLLKRQPASVLALYVIGTVPFLLGFLFYWVDMSWNSFAADRCAGEALAVVLLFFWMKTWQAAFAGCLWESVRAAPPEPWTFGRIADTVFAQALIQPSAVIVLPLALLAVLPFGWAFAFYQSFTVSSGMGKGRYGEDVATAWSEATRDPRQNYALLGILLLWSVVLFLDINVLLRFLPFVLRTLLGIETVFTRRPIPFLNTTALVVSASIAWWCVDPMLKAAYVLRCFYGHSVRTGEDLLVELRGQRVQRRTGAVMLAALFLGLAVLSWHAGAVPMRSSSSPLLARAAQPSILQTAEAVAPLSRDQHGRKRPPARRAGRSAPLASVQAVGPATRVQRLDRTVREVLEQPRYAWRLPRVHAKRKHTSFLLNFMLDALRTVGDWVRRAGRWLGRVLDWLADHLLPKPKPMDLDMWGGNTGWISRLYILAILLLGLVVSCLVFFVIRNRRRRRGEDATNDLVEVAAVPNVEDEGVSPDALPSDRWLLMAGEFAANGEFRLAIRTLYLAGLALLGEEGLITLARHKSNREYEREVERHTHAVQESVPRSFHSAVTLFDRIWYGVHPADAELLARMETNYESLKLSAKNL